MLGEGLPEGVLGQVEGEVTYKWERGSEKVREGLKKTSEGVGENERKSRLTDPESRSRRVPLVSERLGSSLGVGLSL